MVAPHGLIVAPCGLMIEPHGLMVAPHGLIVAPHGLIVEPHGLMTDPGEYFEYSCCSRIVFLKSFQAGKEKTPFYGCVFIAVAAMNGIFAH